jgi:hypothetical protein
LMATASWVSAISTGLAAIAAIIAVLVAFWQLRNLNRTLRVNGLMAVLQLESEINSRKERSDDAVAELERECAREPVDVELVRIVRDQVVGCTENWLNAVDRLAFCILKGYIPERDWKAEYRDYITDLVWRFEPNFRADTWYRNILELHGKWARE